jgi:hypothetical protein
MITSLAGQFFSGDFVNYNVFLNGIYDSRNQTLQTGNVNAGGIGVGGGVALSKNFERSTLSLNYRGEYRYYASGFQGSGTNQYLSLLYSYRFSPRWSLSFDATGGIIFYDSPYYNSVPGGGVVTNPFSRETRFLQAGTFVTYQQTRRLSYVLGGNFIMNRYSFQGAIGSTGGILSASVVYKLTARTTVGGTFSHNNFYYQNDVGTSLIDGGYVNVKHIFGRGWEAYVSGGATRVHSQGVIRQPVEVVIPNGQTVIGYIVGPYDTTKFVPTVEGGLRHNFRRLSVGASAGHGVNPGNGTYLTSSHTFFGGSVSHPLGRQAVISGNVNYARLNSIASTISRQYSQNFINAGYSRVLMPHLSAHVTYTYSRYGNFFSYNGVVDNRLTFGIAYSSKSIPFTLF